MRGFLRHIFREKTDAEKLRLAVIKGDVDVIRDYLDKGGDPVAPYMAIKESGRGHARAIDMLEQEIEDISRIPGTHVPRNADWRIARSAPKK